MNEVTFEKRVTKADKVRKLCAEYMVEAGINVHAENVAIKYEQLKAMALLAETCGLDSNLAKTYVKNNIKNKTIIEMAKQITEE